jgi:hypothetical protein
LIGTGIGKSRNGKFITLPKLREMKYNTKTQSLEAIKHLQRCIDKGSIVEIIEKRKSKSVSQNAYLHAILSMAAIHFGLTLDEVKQVMKHSAAYHLDWISQDKEYEGVLVYVYKSIAKFNSLEINQFIDHIRNFSQLHDCYLPTANEYKQGQLEYDNEIEIQSRYL